MMNLMKTFLTMFTINPVQETIDYILQRIYVRKEN